MDDWIQLELPPCGQLEFPSMSVQTHNIMYSDQPRH